LEAPPGVAMPSSGWCEPGFPEIESTTMTVSGLPAGHRAFDVELRDNPYGATHLLPVHVDAVVKPGETSDLGAVRLDTGVAVSGVVVGADGRPIADASVSSGVAGTRSGANGGFTLSPLPRGRVTLLAKLDRLIAQTPVDASAPPGDFIVRLVRARILLADASALPKDRWFYVRAKAQGATAAAYPMRLPQMDHDARFGSVDARRVAALPLPPGDWTLEVVEEGDVVLATTHVTVPTDGDGPVRVWIPVK
jgi:hypothetical protein